MEGADRMDAQTVRVRTSAAKPAGCKCRAEDGEDNDRFEANVAADAANSNRKNNARMGGTIDYEENCRTVR